MNRRDFAYLSASATAVFAAAATAATGSLTSLLTARRHLPLHAALIDSRFPESRRFGAALATLGATLITINGDILSAWRQTLRAHASQGGAALAGMTTYATLTCLEQLARDYGWRTIARVEHVPNTNGTVNHYISAHPDTVLDLSHGIRSGVGFSRGIAAAVLSVQRPQEGERRISQLADPTLLSAASREQTLVSWVMSAAINGHHQMTPDAAHRLQGNPS